MDSLNSIVVFVKVAETGSFAASGRLLGISASAIGKSIARLEDKLDVRLFHRNTRSIKLTIEGEMFLERCRRILIEIEAAEQELSQVNAAPYGRLRVSLPLVSSLVLPVLGEFMRTYPEVELDLDFTDQVVDVIKDGFDAVLRTGVPHDSRLTARRLGQFRSLLVASPEYLNTHGIPVHPKDLEQHRCLHYRCPHSGKLEPWALKMHPADPPLQLPISMICNNIETRVCFAMQGLGIAYLPDFAIRQQLSTGQLQSVLVDYVERTGVFHILWPAGKHPIPKVRAFVDFLCSNVFLEV
ncbi:MULTISPECIES: LysR family transcriptional regulator [unclassified Acinetobacter]|uniref:LysR family transcriptional regulator n=1 Tax=unclassified Acinetobacter TaxID=196816 RepID=UPI0029349C9B|nr:MULTISPECIES: LysR family transcriptional regulator [unclassified Acinetobacter]WOE30836.1 LysR family transcriptional regulator [Acinetobacter sp. SAAs470]WOE39031.1 LysR family transcriptional regulator [Acinetobacter sp. SAAs474]